MEAETIGSRLRRLRLERGLNQRGLSAPGVSYAYISRIEAGMRQPSVKALRKLADGLGVSVEYLETGSEETLTDTLVSRLYERIGEFVVHVRESGVSLCRQDADGGHVYAAHGGNLTEALRQAHALEDEEERLDQEEKRLAVERESLAERRGAVAPTV
jgi:transcriptional regulator with XRE-family HTH domain